MLRQGAIGALLDVYEEAIFRLKDTIESTSDEALLKIVDQNTKDDNCRSIQTVLSHVIHAGLGYATSIHNIHWHPITRPEKNFHYSTSAYIEDLNNLFTYTKSILITIREDQLEQINNDLKILTTWGQLYDVEQIMEHAIVHVLRHTRQIERMKNGTSIAINKSLKNT